MPIRAIRQALAGRANSRSEQAPDPRPEEASPPSPPPPHVPEGVAHVWDLGHFYSPVPDTRDLAREPARSRVWPQTPREAPGVDWRESDQLALLSALEQQAPMSFPAADTGDPSEYHTGNPNFSALDAWALQAMLRHLRPARVLEVGCGWSSLVTARVNREIFGSGIDVTCVEPYPPEFLAGGVRGIDRLVASQVQDVPLDAFLELGDGDVLFIDTSHVIKTGNDVQYLYLEVLPRLRPGVAVHVHDIFLPFDYPIDWVMGGRGWNEQYLLQAFLTFNAEFEVALAIGWLFAHHRAALRRAAGEAIEVGGGSFWFRRRLRAA